MKYLAILLLGISIQVAADEPASCNENYSKDIAEQISVAEGKIKISVIGDPCYEAKLKIDIFSGKNLIYSYEERFKPHVAIHRESVIERDAKNFIIRQIEDYNFISCSDLPKIEQNGDLPYYDKLLVSEKEYKDFKKSNCKAYIHTYKYYEGRRVIVFPSGEEHSVVVR